jgi:anti-sigma B factor antagonist
VDDRTLQPQAQDDTPFSCVVQRRGHASEIVLEGELDLGARAALDDAARAALEPGPVEAVVLDLRSVTFADSTTIEWLVATDRRARSGRARLVVLTAPGAVRRLLALTGLDERLVLVDGGETLA